MGQRACCSSTGCWRKGRQVLNSAMSLTMISQSKVKRGSKMPQEYSTDLIALPAVSFTGASPKNFGLRLTPCQPEADELRGALRLEWGHEVTGGQMSHMVTLRPRQTGEFF